MKGSKPVVGVCVALLLAACSRPEADAYHHACDALDEAVSDLGHSGGADAAAAHLKVAAGEAKRAASLNGDDFYARFSVDVTGLSEFAESHRAVSFIPIQSVLQDHCHGSAN